VTRVGKKYRACEYIDAFILSFSYCGSSHDEQLFIETFKDNRMPHDYCPCGSLLSRTSTVRTLKSPSLRLFTSIRTMKSVSFETKVCNACRTAYYDWKSNNSEFGDILSRFDNELLESVDIDEDTNSVNNNHCCDSKIRYIFFVCSLD
jgi:hypothetical protein